MARSGVRIGWFIFFVILVYLVIVGIRVAKIYIDDFQLRGVIKQETKYFSGTEMDLIKRIVRKANGINISFGVENISIIERGDTYVVFHVTYTRILDGFFFKRAWNLNYNYETNIL